MVQSNSKAKRVIIYPRVSTDDQDCARQVADLTAFAQQRGFTVVGVYQEKASGAKTDRKVREQVMLQARQGKIDAILVTELSRWSRSTEDLLATLGKLADWGCSLICQTGMEFDFGTPQGKLMVTMLAGFAEFERSLITERVRSGVAAAKARGVLFGRPELNSNKAKRIKELLDAGESIRSVADTMRCSPTTVQKVKAAN